jgi:hypothetical protein
MTLYCAAHRSTSAYWSNTLDARTTTSAHSPFKRTPQYMLLASNLGLFANVRVVPRLPNFATITAPMVGNQAGDVPSLSSARAGDAGDVPSLFSARAGQCPINAAQNGGVECSPKPDPGVMKV